jgi:hypothetical protein
MYVYETEYPLLNWVTPTFLDLLQRFCSFSFQQQQQPQSSSLVVVVVVVD